MPLTNPDIVHTDRERNLSIRSRCDGIKVDKRTVHVKKQI